MTRLQYQHIAFFISLGLIVFTIDSSALQRSVTPPPADNCYENLFCVETFQRGDTVDVYLRNMVEWNLSIEVDMDVDNMSVNRALPLSKTLTPYQRYRALRMVGGRRGGRWSYRYSLKWLVGKIDAHHDDTYVYALPWERGLTFGVGQGYDGMETHAGKKAIDWNMPVGTMVRASREGIVVDFTDRYYEGGVSDDLRTRANFIAVLHSDGTVAQYVHLDYQGVFVEVGDRVRRGEVIGRSGDTGFSSGPHLHFEVYTVTKALKRKTIPVQFRTSSGRAVALVTGESYSH